MSQKKSGKPPSGSVPGASPRIVRDVLDGMRPADLPPPESVEQGLRPAGSDGEIAGLGIVPLGQFNKTCYYLDSHYQLLAIDTSEHTRLTILNLARGNENKLKEIAPRKNADGITVGWKPESIAALMNEKTADCGLFDPKKRVRGAGGWRGDTGELILHCGDRLLIVFANGAPVWKPPGRYGRFVYIGREAGPRPALAFAEGGGRGPAAHVLKLFSQWNWRQPEIDPTLLLGWIGAAMLGAALEWRSMIWITGDMGTGKSTLQGAICNLLGDAVIQVTDATAAGLAQTLQHDCLPVSFDEIEADPDGKKQRDVLELARHCSSGGRRLRGGTDHNATEFTARTSFLFSSILIPPLTGQDRSRITILDLGKLSGIERPVCPAAQLRELGAQLRNRLVNGWHRFDETLARWRQALGQRGHIGRSADQLGTLLACADLLLYDREPSTDELTEWADKLPPPLNDDDAGADQAHCLAHLLSSSLDVYRDGKRTPVGEWLRKAIYGTDPEGKAKARDVLMEHGMRLVKEDDRDFLAIAHRHRGMAEIYAPTHWTTRSGADGPWAQALRRIDGARAGRQPYRFHGVRSRCVLLPIAALRLRHDSADDDDAEPSGE